MRDTSRWIFIGGLLLTGVVLQACDLSEKEIDDVYTAVEGVTAGFEQKEIGIIFPKRYCLASAPVSWAGKLTQSTPPPSAGLLRFEHCAAGSSTCSTFASFSMSLQSDGTIPRQGSTVAGRCFAPDDGMNVYFTPVGGNVQAGAFLHFNFRYNVSDDGDPADERILEVRVSAAKGAKGTVKVNKDKEGKSECALPGPDPKKPNENICHFIYDVPEGGRNLVALALPPDDFREWGDLCKGTRGNACQFVLIGNFDQVSAKFERAK